MYKFISKQSLHSFLENEQRWCDFTDTTADIFNNDILYTQLSDFINQHLNLKKDKESLTQFMQDHKRLATAQLSGWDGYVSKNAALSQQQARARVQTEKGSEISDVIALPIHDNHRESLSTWNQADFLLYQSIFLTGLYIKIKKGYITLPENLTLTMTALLNELWIAFNAYAISEYQNLQQQESVVPTDISTLITDYLAFIKSAPDDSFEFVFPCGYTTHAIYLTLLFYKDKNTLTMRVDNPSRKQPFSYQGIHLNDANETAVQDYLIDVIHVFNQGQDAASCVIYNEANEENKNKAYHQILISQHPLQSGFAIQPKQKAPNCVVEGYRRGRFERFKNFIPICQWLCDKEQAFTTLNHNIPTASDYHQHRLNHINRPTKRMPEGDSQVDKASSLPALPQPHISATIANDNTLEPNAQINLNGDVTTAQHVTIDKSTHHHYNNPPSSREQQDKPTNTQHSTSLPQQPAQTSVKPHIEAIRAIRTLHPPPSINQQFKDWFQHKHPDHLSKDGKAMISNRSLRGENLDGLDFSFAYCISTIFSQANVKKTKFNGTHMEQANMSGAQNLKPKQLAKANYRQITITPPDTTTTKIASKAQQYKERWLKKYKKELLETHIKYYQKIGLVHGQS